MKLPTVTPRLHAGAPREREWLQRRNVLMPSRHFGDSKGDSENVTPAGELEGVHDALHALRVLARGDQQGIIGVHDHDVLNAADADYPVRLRDYDAAGGIRQDTGVLPENCEVVAPPVGVEFCEAGEIAHVIPVEVTGDHREAAPR